MDDALFDDAAISKQSARRNREAKRYEDALADISEALGELEAMLAELPADIVDGDEHASAEYSPPVKRLVDELAECYGIKGGILRSKGRPGEAVASYDRGFLFEQHSARKKDNSYNAVQRLVSRVCAEPYRYKAAKWRFLRDDMNRLLDDTIRLVKSQVEGPRATRAGDAWAAADILFLNILHEANSEGVSAPAVVRAFEEFQRAKPSRFARESTARAFRELGEYMAAPAKASNAAASQCLQDRLEYWGDKIAGA